MLLTFIPHVIKDDVAAEHRDAYYFNCRRNKNYRENKQENKQTSKLSEKLFFLANYRIKVLESTNFVLTGRKSRESSNFPF